MAEHEKPTIDHAYLDKTLGEYEERLKRDRQFCDPTLWWFRMEARIVPFADRREKLLDYAADFIKWRDREEVDRRKQRGDDRAYVLWIDHETSVRREGFLAEVCRMVGHDQQLIPFIQKALIMSCGGPFEYAQYPKDLVKHLKAIYKCLIEIQQIGHERVSKYD